MGNCEITRHILKNNILITGKTFAGKSVLLRKIISDLMDNYRYDFILTLADAKTIEFSIFKETAVKVIFSAKDFAKQLKSILSEIKYREEQNIKFPQSIFIVDEFVDYALVDPSILKDLMLIAKTGKKWGCNLILATQNIDSITDIQSGFTNCFKVKACFKKTFYDKPFGFALEKFEYAIREKFHLKIAKEKCEYLSPEEVLNKVKRKYK